MSPAETRTFSRLASVSASDPLRTLTGRGQSEWVNQASQDLFIDRAVFGAGQLAVVMSDGRAIVGTLQFEFVRSFLFVKESDFWADIEKIEKALVFQDALAPRVHRVARRALGEAIMARRFDEEEPMTFFVWTPDECFEVVCFAEPTWTRTETPRV